MSTNITEIQRKNIITMSNNRHPITDIMKITGLQRHYVDKVIIEEAERLTNQKIREIKRSNSRVVNGRWIHVGTAANRVLSNAHNCKQEELV